MSLDHTGPNAARPKPTLRESQSLVPPGVICGSGTGHQHQMMFRDILWLLWQSRPMGMDFWVTSPARDKNFVFFTAPPLLSQPQALPLWSMKSFLTITKHWSSRRVCSEQGFGFSCVFQATFFIQKATDEHSCSLLGSITAPWLSCSLLEDSKWKRFPYPAQRSREAESGGQSRPTLTSQQLQNSLQDH